MHAFSPELTRPSSSPPHEPGESLLCVQGLVKRFGRRQVVCGVDLEVGSGEIVGLLGANGAGKSTTFRMLVGLLAPDAGMIRFAGEEITSLPMFLRARRGMGYLAQEPTIFAHLSVADNIRMVLEHHCPRREREARLDALLAELRLTSLRDAIAGRCSGGERRRLEITRALVVDPKLLFFDEPFAGVDPKSRDDIRAISQELKQRGISVLITDHNAEAIMQMVDRLYVMESGSILASGTPAEIIANPEVRRAYLGDSFMLPGGPVAGALSP
ncbi:MAG: LPS export ABC transporter ATP-binding protein [Planctomycetota bacterium]|nr:MAG: LPS export ABC transporter ATP-binding protein [Planctomycetota bacterium]